MTITASGAKAQTKSLHQLQHEYTNLQTRETHDALRKRAEAGQADAHDLAVLDRLDGLAWMLT